MDSVFFPNIYYDIQVYRRYIVFYNNKKKNNSIIISFCCQTERKITRCFPQMVFILFYFFCRNRFSTDFFSSYSFFSRKDFFRFFFFPIIRSNRIHILIIYFLLRIVIYVIIVRDLVTMNV